jgi:hypothetical protein
MCVGVPVVASDPLLALLCAVVERQQWHGDSTWRDVVTLKHARLERIVAEHGPGPEPVVDYGVSC